jgi:hypothetical protein
MSKTSPDPNDNISYRTVVSSIRDNLAAARFPQNPCLEGTNATADQPFLI